MKKKKLTSTKLFYGTTIINIIVITWKFQNMLVYPVSNSLSFDTISFHKCWDRTTMEIRKMKHSNSRVERNTNYIYEEGLVQHEFVWYHST